MDEMTAFEERLAAELERVAGPRRMVDARSIRRAAAAQASGVRWTGFSRRLRGDRSSAPAADRFAAVLSVVKLVAAATIVALFGGFLLAGILTTQRGVEVDPAAVTGSPSPMTTDELLSGFVTEEIEPGVLRIVSDGIGDLPADSERLVAGADGSVWLFTTDSYFRLGDERLEWQRDARLDHAHIEVAPDGTVWAVGVGKTTPGRRFREDLRSLDGDQWTVRKAIRDDGQVSGLAIQPDGTVWASWVEDEVTTVARLTDDGWLPAGNFHEDAMLIAADDVGPWVTAADIGGPDRYHRYDGSAWPEPDLPPGTRGVDVGTDGTIWVDVCGSESGCFGFPSWRARFDATGWTEWEDVLDRGAVQVAPDGSLWGPPLVPVDEDEACHGVARFDGTTLTGYLQGLCIGDMDITADGTVWLLAGSDVVSIDGEGRKDLAAVEMFVIRPKIARAGG